MEKEMDLSAVVSLIMKHPELIEQIGALARGEGEKVSVEEENGTGVESASESRAVVSEPALEGIARADTPSASRSKRENRKRLFSAIRPFLSDERAKTLSSVEAVVSILDSLHS